MNRAANYRSREQTSARACECVREIRNEIDKEVTVYRTRHALEISNFQFKPRRCRNGVRVGDTRLSSVVTGLTTGATVALISALSYPQDVTCCRCDHALLKQTANAVDEMTRLIRARTGFWIVPLLESCSPLSLLPGWEITSMSYGNVGLHGFYVLGDPRFYAVFLLENLDIFFQKLRAVVTKWAIK
ncbi:hypothetical protein CBL_07894 [Carabus blaptoides fortunei]